MTRRVRIGNGCGFWGDNADAPVVLARRGDLALAWRAQPAIRSTVSGPR